MERVFPDSPVDPNATPESKTDNTELNEMLERVTDLAQKSLDELKKQDRYDLT